MKLKLNKEQKLLNICKISLVKSMKESTDQYATLLGVLDAYLNSNPTIKGVKDLIKTFDIERYKKRGVINGRKKKNKNIF